MMMSKVKEESEVGEWFIVQHLVRQSNQVFTEEKAADEI